MTKEEIKRQMKMDFGALANAWYSKARTKNVSPFDTSVTFTEEEWKIFQQVVELGCIGPALLAVDKMPEYPLIDKVKNIIHKFTSSYGMDSNAYKEAEEKE